MCGIWASIGTAADKRVIDVIAHRGPDGEGWMEFDSVAGPVTLGHRRLAILDLSPTGAQPMASADGRTYITFNGEIYNHRELRADLSAKGHSFRGHSDTEVLLEAFIAWGPACLERLNGMFAFAILDERTQRLFVARDRLGVKPLYLAPVPGGWAFASEVKQILALPGFGTPRLSQTGVRRYLRTGGQSADGSTMFDGIVPLPPGHFVDVDLRAPQVRPIRWFDLAASLPEAPLSGKGFLSRFNDLMADAVRLRLETDVPVGALLSGGLDSSTIVSFAAQARRDASAEMMTFSSWGADEATDERVWSRAVAAQWGLPNVEAEIQEGVFAEELDRLILHQEEPFSTTSVFSEWNIYRTIKNNTDLKVVLDGQGADELLVGYYSMLPAFLSHLLRSGRVLRAAWEMAAILRRHRNLSAKTMILDTVHATAPGALAALRRALGRGTGVAALLRHDSGCDDVPRQEDFRAYQLRLVNESIYPQLQWQDRSSMAFSIESRHPFLDYRLIQLMLTTDPAAKVRNGRTKALLRQAVTGLLPEEVRLRDRKFGFPGTDGPRLTHGWHHEILAGARTAALALGDILDQKLVTDRLREFERSGRQWGDAWQLYSFERWRHLFCVSV
jgi:asparagine synthase (glutamine-hydrolysing)